MLCPRCSTSTRPAIEPTPAGAIELDYCPSCRGIWFDRGELEALLLQVRSDIQPIGLPTPSDEPASRRCPRHGVLMIERTLSTARLRSSVYGQSGEVPDGVTIDQCPACLGIWLDGGELGQITQAMRGESVHPLLRRSSPPIEPSEAETDRPTSGLLWAFMFLTGLPVEEHQPRRNFPIVVLSLLILCVMAFLMQLGASDPTELIQTFGLVPRRAMSGVGSPWPWLTYMFLHGGFLHLFGNLYFLWVFGDNVEDRLGRGRFLLLYFAAGISAALLQCVLQTSSTIPIVGASGAISGVMAAYAILFPNARLVSLIWVIKVQWQTTTYLGVWLLLQFIGALSGASGVAWWAHIGGFLVGGLIAWTWRRSHQEEVTRKLAPPGATPPKRLTWY